MMAGMKLISKGLGGRFKRSGRSCAVSSCSVLILVSLLLAACGGGGSSGSGSDSSAGSEPVASQSSVSPSVSSVPAVSVAPTASSAPTASESTVSPSETTVPSETSQPPSEPSTAELTALYEGELDELIEVTERMRGLEFITPPKIILLDEESFAERTASGLEEEFFDDFDAEGAMYKLLGLLKPDASLRQIYTDIFTTGTTGYYDSDKKEIVVPIRGTGISVRERLTLVHELTHALTDQHFNFEEKSNVLEENNETDKIFALAAVIEGDAVAMERRYLEEGLTEEERAEITGPEPCMGRRAEDCLTEEERAELIGPGAAGSSNPRGSLPTDGEAADGSQANSVEACDADAGSDDRCDAALRDQEDFVESAEWSDALASARTEIPEFLNASFSFPYNYGSIFLRTLLGRDADDITPLGDEDFAKINQFYVFTPVSTEQIYFPNKYQSEAPLEVEHPVADLPDYELVETSTWGASTFAQMFDQVLGMENPELFDASGNFASGKEITGADIMSLSPSRSAVKGWGGDRYSLWFNGSEVAFAMTYRGDEASDAEELAETMREYVSTGMNVGEAEVSGDTVTWNAGEGGAGEGKDFAWLSVEGDTLRFVAASDPAVGAELVAFYEAA